MSQGTANTGELNRTKRTFIAFVTGEYLITGYFWFFLTVGAVRLKLHGESNQAAALLISIVALLAFSAIWDVITGWYADRWSRRFSLVAGFVMMAVGFALMIVAVAPEDDVFLAWTAGIAIWSLGPALLSGAQEAWLVDRCKFLADSDTYDDFELTFRRSAAIGIIAKTVGTAMAFALFFSLSSAGNSGGSANHFAFAISAGVASVISIGLAGYCWRLSEEYWEDPKYHKDETIFAFLLTGLCHLVKPPYVWFTVAYVGALGLNYIPSATAWPYLCQLNNGIDATLQSEIVSLFLLLLGTELVGGLMSMWLSRRLDRIGNPALRIASVASLQSVPTVLLIVMILCGRDKIVGLETLYVVILVSAFLYKSCHAAVFGMLNTQAQVFIKRGEIRAGMISLSSAFALLLTTVPFLLVHNWVTQNRYPDTGITGPVRDVWLYGTPMLLLFLLIGGIVVVRVAQGRKPV